MLQLPQKMISPEKNLRMLALQEKPRRWERRVTLLSRQSKYLTESLPFPFCSLELGLTLLFSFLSSCHIQSSSDNNGLDKGC
jgi:hypothetical protein